MHLWAERLPELEFFASAHDVLHVGSGRSGYGTTLDISPSVGADIVADLSKRLPIPDDSYDAVYAFSILEHLTDLVFVMGELHRIVRTGGFIAVLVPHFSSASAFTDPTHVRGFSVNTFDYFIEGTKLFEEYGWYSSARFRKRERLLQLESKYLNRALGGLVNRRSESYERFWCFMLRGSGVYFELEVV